MAGTEQVRRCCSTCSAPSSTGARASSPTCRHSPGSAASAGDWAQFADDWRGLYQPSMEAVRSGQRPWTILDALHRESLDQLLPRYGLAHLPAADIDHINRVWHRLPPWPDALPGLVRLKSRFIIGPLSNGNVGLLVRMAKHAGLPWDVILSAETARAYKPMPASYTESARLLNLAPGEVMLVAAHNGDLAAAQAAGLATGFRRAPDRARTRPDQGSRADRGLGRRRRELH